MIRFTLRRLTGILILFLIRHTAIAQTPAYPDPVKNPSSPLMLAGDWVPEETHQINFDKLPHVPYEYGVVNDVRYAWGRKVNQHIYITFYAGEFWIMWSDGPGVPHDVTAKEHRTITPHHDQPGQLISYATSKDGIHWTERRDLAGPPDDGFGWIARGFWIRDGKLLGLASRYQAPGYEGDGLQLHAFEMHTGTPPVWTPLGMVYDNTLNNFPPKKLPNGKWMMSRRDKKGDVFMMVGGDKSFDEWESFPVRGSRGQALDAEEPYWLLLPDGNAVALFRDNNKSGYLYRSFSLDNGQTWSNPVQTNYPDATSKFCALRLQDGRYILVSNANPAKRDPLTLAISDDGLVFNKMYYVFGGHTVDYPHVMEKDGFIYIVFDSSKQSVEVVKIKISDLDSIEMPSPGDITLKP